jgi:protein-disulfide isomerase
MYRKVLASVAFGALALTPACAQSSSIDTADKEAIGEIVREYILENPEIIEEALIALTEKEREATAEEQRKAIASNSDALYGTKSDYFIGPADAKVTVVEFFDYRCGYCKRSIDWIQELPEKYDGDVRVVFKELPILSPESEQAALAALAAGKQGKYTEMHVGLMELESSTGFKPADIDKVAKAAGVDVKKMRADMRSIAVQKQLSDMKALGRSLGVGGTPSFFIGDEAVPGGANEDVLNKMIKEELAS